MTRKLVIFDMDGLLFDSERVYRDGWYAAFEKSGLPAPASLIEEGMGKSWKKLRQSMIDSGLSPEQVADLYGKREEYILSMLDAGEIRMKPFARETIQAARAAGLKTALATSSRKPRYGRYLKKYGLEDLFDICTGADEVSEPKPDPEVYLKSLKAAGVQPSEAFVCEDSGTGARAALAAGIEVVLVPDLEPADPELAARPDVTVLQTLEPVYQALKEGKA